MGVVSAAVRTHREFIVRLVKPKRFSVGLDGFVEDNILSMFSTASRLSVVYLSAFQSGSSSSIVSRWSNGFDF
jgi:hypothetical protein